jgi:hypothetical protein
LEEQKTEGEVVPKMERLLPSRGTSTSNVLMHQAHIIIVMSRLRDTVFCGTPLALANCMNHETLTNNQFESTYALLVRSEEKGRGGLEVVLYVAFILSAVLLIWEFAQGPVNIRAAGFEHGIVSEAAMPQAISQS